ncbi:MAG TPA: hypothetical protein PL009_14375, partial [Flavipsychrobacter sp.]|nr:hypothetical protein [Flavipsychrobacter sp.]
MQSLQRRYLLLLTGILFFVLASCEKEVNVSLNSGEPRLVIEGQIENGGYPFVVLTKSIGYFSRIDLTTLENAFVHGAIITVSDGASSITLKEYSLDTGFTGTNKFYLYTIDTTDPTAFSFRGNFEKQYT